MKTQVIIKQSKTYGNKVEVTIYNAHTSGAIAEVSNKIILKNGQFKVAESTLEEVKSIYDNDDDIARNWHERNGYVTVTVTYKRSNKVDIHVISNNDWKQAQTALDILKDLPELTWAKSAEFEI